MQNTQNKLLLIIDDSLDNQDLLRVLFEEQGFQVYTASNGKEALGLLSDLTYLPQIILLDAQMPVMDGFEFRIEQRKIKRIKNIPVIVMTGDDDYLVDKKMNYPCKVLVKPLQMKILIESVLSLN